MLPGSCPMSLPDACTKAPCPCPAPETSHCLPRPFPRLPKSPQVPIAPPGPPAKPARAGSAGRTGASGKIRNGLAASPFCELPGPGEPSRQPPP